jgi:hypothetical protein
MAHVLALNIDRDNPSFWATISVLTLTANQCEIVKRGNSKTCQLLKFENVVTVHKSYYHSSLIGTCRGQHESTDERCLNIKKVAKNQCRTQPF